MPDLLEEVVRQILAAMVHPQGQPAGDGGVHREHPHAVGPPHDLRRRGDDGPVVDCGSPWRPRWGDPQPVRAHHAQHSGPGDADPVQDPQPRMHLPMTLALERRASEVRAKGRQQLFVRVGRRRPAPCRLAPLPAPRPPVPQPDPSAQARDRPGPAPSTPPGDIARPRPHATPRRATPRAAVAAQRPACGSRSTAAPAPGPPPACRGVGAHSSRPPGSPRPRRPRSLHAP